MLLTDILTSVKDKILIPVKSKISLGVVVVALSLGGCSSEPALAEREVQLVESQKILDNLPPGERALYNAFYEYTHGSLGYLDFQITDESKIIRCFGLLPDILSPEISGKTYVSIHVSGFAHKYQLGTSDLQGDIDSSDGISLNPKEFDYYAGILAAAYRARFLEGRED